MPTASHSERLTAQVETLLASLDEALDEDPSAQPTASRTASLTSSLLADSAMAPPPTPGGGSGLFASIGAPAFVSPFSMRTGSPFGTRAAASISPFAAAAAAAASAQSSPSDGAPPPLTPAPSSDGAGGGGRARGANLGELESQLLADRPAMATSCAPLSRHEWTERLSTFSREHLWARKPACVSPPSCARRGWTLVGLDTLRCSACGARLHIPPSLTAAENHARLVELVETSSHLPLCPWRGNASPESISRLLLPAFFAGHGPALAHLRRSRSAAWDVGDPPVSSERAAARERPLQGPRARGSPPALPPPRAAAALRAHPSEPSHGFTGLCGVAPDAGCTEWYHRL